MAVIQAYRRDKPYTHFFPDLKLILQFKANEEGAFVCAVDNPVAIERLLAVPTGFKRYKDEPKAAPAPEDHEYVLKRGHDILDLRLFSDEQLRAFAEANNIKVHHLAKGDTIRDRIVAALRVEE
jgi:hypothetical protein